MPDKMRGRQMNSMNPPENRKCQFFKVVTSSCLRQPTTLFMSKERGPIWVCVNKHLNEMLLEEGVAAGLRQSRPDDVT